MPNELLVALTPDAASRLELQLTEGRPADAVQLTDSPSDLFRRLKVRLIEQVFRLAARARSASGTSESNSRNPSTTAQGRGIDPKPRISRNARASALDRFFRIELDGADSLDAAIEQFSNHPGVVFAEPNYYYFADAEPNVPLCHPGTLCQERHL